eukprot:9889055-Alexandrium_andersonii.AAC.1
MSASLVGSEMCIRDSPRTSCAASGPCVRRRYSSCSSALSVQFVARDLTCLLYTSDAADVCSV